MTNKELIEIAKTLDICSDNESLYRFAASVLEKSEPSAFFAIVQDIFNACKGKEIIDENIKNALGKIGGAGDTVKKWCEGIIKLKLSCEHLSRENLRYVMGTAARLCKVKKSDINSPDSSRQRNNNRSRSGGRYSSNEPPRTFVFESKTVVEKPKEYFCKYCKQKLEIFEEKMQWVGNGRTKIICAKCGKQNLI